MKLAGACHCGVSHQYFNIIQMRSSYKEKPASAGSYKEDLDS